MVMYGCVINSQFFCLRVRIRSIYVPCHNECLCIVKFKIIYKIFILFGISIFALDKSSEAIFLDVDKISSSFTVNIFRLRMIQWPLHITDSIFSVLMQYTRLEMGSCKGIVHHNNGSMTRRSAYAHTIV